MALLLQNTPQSFFGHGVDHEIGFALRVRGLKHIVVEAKIAAAAQRFDLGHVMHRSFPGLSEGRKPRVALAGLYANGVRVLVLDEPSSNVDAAGTRDLANRPASLRSIADRVLSMSAERIVADGVSDSVTYDELERSPDSGFVA